MWAKPIFDEPAYGLQEESNLSGHNIGPEHYITLFCFPLRVFNNNNKKQTMTMKPKFPRSKQLHGPPEQLEGSGNISGPIEQQPVKYTKP